MDPVLKFKEWYAEELQYTSAKIPSACCLSTVGEDGYPNARFLSLKEIKEERFVITGPKDSRKGKEILSHPKVALTFWWAYTERQVRIQGNAAELHNDDADQYFKDRNREAQIVSLVSKQGSLLESPESLNKAYEETEKIYEGNEIPRPENWSGFYIEPIRIEFLQFRETRFHERILFTRINGGWEKEFLQP